MDQELILKCVSKWINNYIDKNNIEPQEIAEQLECSSVYIERLLDYEKNRRDVPLRLGFISKLMETYNISIDEILENSKEYRQAKLNREKLLKLVNLFKDKLIGEQLDIEQIKNELGSEITINNVIKNDKFISFEIKEINILEMERLTIINRFDVILKENIIVYLVVEQKFSTLTVDSLKQRYYLDKQNEMFVSSVHLKDMPMLFDLSYETMMQYNNESFYLDRYKESDDAVKFNDKIFEEIVNGKTIEEIKNEYNNMD